MTSIDWIVDQEYHRSELDEILIYDYGVHPHKFLVWSLIQSFPKSFFRWALG